MCTERGEDGGEIVQRPPSESVHVYAAAARVDDANDARTVRRAITRYLANMKPCDVYSGDSCRCETRKEKSFLTHKLDAQVICCFGREEGGGEGEREREKEVIIKHSVRWHCVTANSQIITGLLFPHARCCIGVLSAVTWSTC